MEQLSFNDTFTDYVFRKPPLTKEVTCWKKYEDIPPEVISFIDRKLSEMVIEDSSSHKLYCSNCFNLLEDGVCLNCHKEYKNLDNSKYHIEAVIDDLKIAMSVNYFYAFDIHDGEVYLYVLKNKHIFAVQFAHDNIRSNYPSIEKVYHVTKDGITDIYEKKDYYFADYDKEYKSLEADEENLPLTAMEKFDWIDDYKDAFLYLDNLEDLKQVPFYKYSYIWEGKDFLDSSMLHLSSLTCYPIYYRTFEYLIKMKLYNLAFHASNLIAYKGNFKDTFGVEKKYYPLMKEMDITYAQLDFLRKFPTFNKDVIRFFDQNDYLMDDLSRYVSFEKLKDYFDEQNLRKDNLFEYCDYIDAAETLGMNMHDKRVLFPSNLLEAHDQTLAKKIADKSPEIDEKIKKLSSFLTVNNFEDDKYVIFPAKSVQDLIDESRQMSNCVRTYAKQYSDNICQIYFMRLKESPQKSLVTIEVRNGKIVQARSKFNNDVLENEKKVLTIWERQLLPIMIE